MTLPLDDYLVGNDSGWVLTFHSATGGKINETPNDLEIGRDDYYAEIQATLPGKLEGGSYTFTVEGILDEHYRKIKDARACKLYLFWRDVNDTKAGYLASVAGLTDVLKFTAGKADPEKLVAVLAITGVKRRATARRYEAVITAREWVYDRLEQVRLTDQKLAARVASQPLLDGAGSLVAYAGLPASTRTPTGATEQVLSVDQGVKLTEILGDIAGRVEKITNNHGRGLMLIRDGKLHLGERDFPVGGRRDTHRLTAAAGLVESETLPDEVSNPHFDQIGYEQGAGGSPGALGAIAGESSAAAGSSGPAPSGRTRPAWRLTLKGRPDIKPGSVVEFTPPLEDQPPAQGSIAGGLVDLAVGLGGAFTGGLLANLSEFDEARCVSLYIQSVEHRLGRATGFVTTLTGVAVADLRDPWDHHTERSAQTDESPPTAAPGPAGRVAEAVSRTVRRAVSALRLEEVGEVRVFNPETTGDLTAQTETVWRGLVPDHGEAFQARRLNIQRPTPSALEGVPYVSPYAWCKTGLILPRYPGMRVLLAHRNGNHADPLDIGALWGPQDRPETQPGDYWLILPAGVSEGDRASIADSPNGATYAGPCTQDLIDADGNRIIEVGELTVRVTRTGLKQAGERPTRPAQQTDQDAITIEHVDGGARIVIKSDGSIQIKGTKIELDAGSGDITLKASNVKAQVTGNFDVS